MFQLNYTQSKFYGFEFECISDFVSLAFTEKKSYVFVQKFYNGCKMSVLCMNPLYHPFILYGILKRTEKRLKKDLILNKDWKF
jgi:hypothetical protein